MAFASNLLCLDIGDGLLSLVNEAESKARETVHQAEEELEGTYIHVFTCIFSKKYLHVCVDESLYISIILYSTCIGACIYMYILANFTHVYSMCVYV